MNCDPFGDYNGRVRDGTDMFTCDNCQQLQTVVVRAGHRHRGSLPALADTRSDIVTRVASGPQPLQSQQCTT